MFPSSFYVATLIIDKEDAIVEETEAQLGGGRPPTTGGPYRSVTAELNEVAEELRQACRRAAVWQGPAGIVFAAEINTYCDLVTQMAVIHWAVAQLIDKQVTAILVARKALEDIAFRLVVEKTKAQSAALSGTPAASLAIQSAAAKEAEYRRRAVVAKLVDITAGHAAQVSTFRKTMTGLAKKLGGGAAGAAFPFLDASTMVVDTATLASVASAVGNCSIALTGLLYAGPWIVDEVRLTHGNGITGGFNAALALFESARDTVLTAAVGEIDARATSLDDAVEMYEECDQTTGFAFAQVLPTQPTG